YIKYLTTLYSLIFRHIFHSTDICAFIIFFIFYFFFHDPPTTEIYTLSLHDALPISTVSSAKSSSTTRTIRPSSASRLTTKPLRRSEEHTSELQSPDHLVCRLLLEKKKKKRREIQIIEK